MNLFKKSLIGVFVLITLFSAGKIFADNTTTFYVGNGTCNWDGIVSLNKTNYYPGEEIIPDSQTNPPSCPGYQASSIAANGSCFYQNGFTVCPPPFSLFAPNNPGDYEVIFNIQIDHIAGPNSSSAFLQYAVVPLPPITVTANPNPAYFGQTSQISWNAPQALSCGVSGPGRPPERFMMYSSSDSISTIPLYIDRTFYVNCNYGPGVTSSQSITIAVNNPPPSVDLIANPNPVNWEQTSQISWTASGVVNSCTSSTGLGGNGITGSFTTIPLHNSTTYSVTCNRDQLVVPNTCYGQYWDVSVWRPCSDFSSNQTNCLNHSSGNSYCSWVPSLSFPSATASDSEIVGVSKASLNFNEAKPKDLVRKNYDGLTGRSYLEIKVNDLPSGNSCVLKKIGGITYPEVYTNSPYTKYKDVSPNSNDINQFQLQCTNSVHNSAIVEVLGQSGTLATTDGGNSCEIGVGQSTCPKTITWGTTNPGNNPVTQTKIYKDNMLVSTGNSGNILVNVPYSYLDSSNFPIPTVYKTVNKVDAESGGTNTVDNILETIELTASCVANTEWNGLVCASTIKPDLTTSQANPTNNTVNTGGSKVFTSVITNRGNAHVNYTGVNQFGALWQVAIDPNASQTGGGTAFLENAQKPSFFVRILNKIFGESKIASATTYFVIENYNSTSMVPSIPVGGTQNITSPAIPFPNAGTYYVRACSDKSTTNMLGIVPESSEGNNCGDWATVVVSAPVSPDLTAGETTPTSAIAGIGRTYTASIRNEGTAGTGTGFYNLFQTATGFDDPILQIGPKNPAVYSASQSMAALGIGASNTATSSTITFTNTGTYYMRACADLNTSWNGSITESDETNNCGPWSLVQVDPSPTIDLRASVPSPAVAFMNIPMNFTSVISNIGNTATGGTFYNIFKIATEANGEGSVSTITSTPYPMSALGPNGLATATSASYTFTGSPTTRSVQACADLNTVGNGSIAEIPASNENNNCSSWVNITFASPPTGTLTATDCTIPLDGSTCNTSLTWNTVNPVSGGVSVVTTNPNNTVVRSGLSGSNVPYPVGHPSRTFYLYHGNSELNAILLATKTANATCEKGIWNGTICTDVIVGADLVASNTTPTTAASGVATAYSSTITNIGTTATTTGVKFTNLFQVSTLPNGGGTITDYPTADPMNPLLAGGSSVATASITLPVGTYYMRACADKSSAGDTGVITESDEDHNCSNWVTVTVSPVNIDLIASNVTPTIVASGVETKYSSTIKNQGSQTTGVKFHNLFQVSTEPNGGGIVKDYPTEIMDILPGGASSVATALITLDKTSYMRACADKKGAGDEGVVKESDENNNCSKDWIEIIPGKPFIDLIASNVTPEQNPIFVNVKTDIFVDITNQGSISTGKDDFINLFQVSTKPNGEGDITDYPVEPPMSDLGAGETKNISNKFIFDKEGTYYIRACADKKGAGDEGLVKEKNEDNNCSKDWIEVNIVPEGTLLDGVCTLTHNLCGYGHAINISFDDDFYYWDCEGDSGMKIDKCKESRIGGGEEINIDFTAKPARIFKGRASTLTWKATGATSCTGSTNNGETFDTEGKIEGTYQAKPADTTIYKLTCTGTDSGGGVISAEKDAEVKVSVIKFFEI